MNDHLAQAKKLHDELKRKNDVDAVQRLTEFLSRYEGKIGLYTPRHWEMKLKS